LAQATPVSAAASRSIAAWASVDSRSAASGTGVGAGQPAQARIRGGARCDCATISNRGAGGRLVRLAGEEQHQTLIRSSTQILPHPGELVP
jgi:hypothetical protein